MVGHYGCLILEPKSVPPPKRTGWIGRGKCHMEKATTDLKRNGKDLSGRVHLLPCCVKHERSNGMERKSFEKHKRTSVFDVPVITCKLTHKAFVERNYKELKTLNPKLPILIRECSGVEPQLWARYDLGVEKGIKLEGLSEAQIFKALEDLVNI
ncbi:hypothetical protein JHK86_004843 [Glycine max]|nr:hypothetical protein JHK86_004843 [Glycine max]